MWLNSFFCFVVEFGRKFKMCINYCRKELWIGVFYNNFVELKGVGIVIKYSLEGIVVCGLKFIE